MSFEAQLDAITKNLLSGWDGIDDAGRVGRAAREQDARDAYEAQMREAKLIAAALGDDDGAAALGVLIRKTLWRPESVEEQGAKSAEHVAILKSRREGQRDVVFMILDMLRFARGEGAQSGGDA